MLGGVGCLMLGGKVSNNLTLPKEANSVLLIRRSDPDPKNSVWRTTKQCMDVCLSVVAV